MQMNKEQLTKIITAIVGTIVLIALAIIFLPLFLFLIFIIFIYSLYYRFFKRPKEQVSKTKTKKINNVIMDAEYKEK